MKKDNLIIAKKKFKSRLIVGTGKYKTMSECAKAIKLSGAEIVTVAVRRVNISDKNKPLLMDYIDPKKITYLPNTAGCFNSKEALRTLRLAIENVGAAAIMPLAAPIGSGLGIQNKINIQIIRKQTKLPLIIDAGLGQASDATIAMELGCDGVLVNTAIAKAKKPFDMALAFKNAVIAGRQSYKSGRIDKTLMGNPSSPLKGII
jgi:thiazole synthase